MLGRRDDQANFFDREVFSRMIPEDHPLVEIKRAVDFSFVEDATRHLYDPENGRPSYPPETLFKVLFLEVWANLSDVQDSLPRAEVQRAVPLLLRDRLGRSRAGRHKTCGVQEAAGQGDV